LVSCTNPSGGSSAQTAAVYACGWAENSSGVSVAGYWQNRSGVAIAIPYGSPYPAGVGSAIISGSDVNIGGFTFTSNGVRAAGYWKDGTWGALNNPAEPGCNASVNSLEVSP